MSYSIGCKVQSAGWQARLRVEERSVPSFVKSETATEDATSSFKETRKIGENALEDPDASEDEVAVDRKLYACEGEKGRKLQEFVDEFILNQEVQFDPGEDDEPTPAERAAKAIGRRLKKEQEISYVKTSPHHSQDGKSATQISKLWEFCMTSFHLHCSAG